MAYNLESLLKILDDILHSHNKTWILDDNQNDQLESLFQKVSSLKHLFENTSHLRGQQIEALESEIRDVSHEAEDIIEPCMVEQMMSKPYDTSLKTFLSNLSRVMEKFDAVVAKLMKIKEQSHETIDVISSSLVVSDSTPSDPTSITKLDTVVGFDRDMLQLKDRLTSQTTKLRIIAIVGMGGIGKTTLARKLYDDPLIRSHFLARAWVTVSQDYSIRAILLDLLRCIVGKLSEEMMQAKNNKLALILYQSLYSQRYLVVVDDIWSIEAWDEIKQFFPNENLRSRILLTTRELNVAKYADSSCELHQMHLLNDLQSWQLFQHKAFGKESCPPSLEGIGQKIARNCGGLPLAISVIGGLLSENGNREELWDQVARDVSSVAAERDEHFSKIFSLSYNHLPYHLKPCFLYMAAFPEDYDVNASKLVTLWVAEGFLKPSETKNPEEAAEEYLEALVSRNLLTVRQYRSNGKAKSYNIHDLLRELCVRKAREEKLFWVKNKKIENGSFSRLRRVSVHPSYRIRDVYASAEHMSLARSFLCTGLASREILSPVFLALKLLRVLDVFHVKFAQFPEQVLQLGNLRFLAISARSDLPSGISRLRNLQTLIAELRSLNYYVDMPSELWNIPELRHVKMKNYVITIEANCYPVTQEKLLTLSYITMLDLVGSSGLLRKIPNIKKLGISCGEHRSMIADLRPLQNLEALRLWGHSNYMRNLPEIKFPQTMKKLTLANYMIPQSFMSTIGSQLPDLRVLKIKRCSFLSEGDETDAEWEINEGEFGSLQYVLLEQVDMVRWKADEDDACFPRLRHLVIRKCNALEGIPSSFGDIASLERIELDESNPTLMASVRQFEEEQRDNGNESLQILIDR